MHENPTLCLRFSRRVGAVLALGAALICSCARAQSRAASSSLPDAPQAQDSADPKPKQTQDPEKPPVFPQAPAEEKPRTSDEVLRQEEKQRLLGVIPTFTAVNASEKILPLRPGQKFHLFFKSSTDPFVIGLDAIVAAIGQAEDSNSGVERVKNPDGTTSLVRYGFGQGAQGYFKRFGASYADTFDGNFWGNAVLPILLKEDPRYYRLGHGSAFRRMLYAASTTVWARRDSGKWGPNYANLGGNFIGGAISNLYYPSQEGGVTKTIIGALTVTAEGTFGAELIEFSPEITTHVLHRKHPAAP